MSDYALRPSGASRWVPCSGYLQMAAAHPEREGDDNAVREQGNAFHTAIYRQAMNHQTYQVDDVIDTGVMKIDVDDFMLECIAEWIDELRRWTVPVYLEDALPCPDIHPQCGGTGDAWGVDMNKRRIYLMDAKYGYRPVDPFESMQLGCYLSGIMTKLGVPKDGLHEQYWEVEFIIYQPRVKGPSFKRWVFSIAEYGRGLFNRLRLAAHAAMSETTQLRSGSHCLDCEAAASCPALQTASMTFLDVVDVTHSKTLTGQELGYELRLLDHAEAIIKARKSALDGEGLYRAKQGEPITGYTLEPTATRRKWNDGVEQGLIQMVAAMGMGDIAKPQRAITPTQAAAIIGQSMTDQFSHRPPGALKLVKQNANDIRKAFSQ